MSASDAAHSDKETSVYSHMQHMTRPRLTSSGPAGVIPLSGSPRDQGYAHGRAARDDILANLTAIQRQIDGHIARGRRYDYDAALRRNAEFIEREAPEILDELHGIADGAGTRLHDVLLLNIPLYVAAQFLPLDCTQVLLMPPATGDGRTYLAKTRDLGDGGLKQVVLHRHYPNGRELIEVNTAGSVTWPGSGINGDGVAISTSGVWSRRTVLDWDRLGHGWFLINGHLLLRDSRSLDDVWQRLKAQRRVTGLNIVVANRQAGAAFEATSDTEVRHDAADGVIVRTNHYLAPALQRLAPTPAEHPSSHQRYETAWTKVRAAAGAWDEHRLIGLMGDHDGYPQRSICRHAERGEGADTVSASIATLPDGRCWTILDHPCRAGEHAGALNGSRPGREGRERNLT